MKLYDHIIDNLAGRTGKTVPKRYAYRPSRAWAENEEFEMLMQKDMAYELGGAGKPAVSYTCITTDPAAVGEDEILVYGPDLNELKETCSFARVTILCTEELVTGEEKDTEKLFRAIQAMDFVKYHVYPKGYMVRASGQTNREQVRIGKKELKNGMTFERIGASFIRHYKEDARVKSVKMLFITAPDADYAGMAADAKSVTDITSSLSKIIKGMPTECGSCGLREVCDEVEGLKELHFGQNAVQ